MPVTSNEPSIAANQAKPEPGKVIITPDMFLIRSSKDKEIPGVQTRSKKRANPPGSMSKNLLTTRTSVR